MEQIFIRVPFASAGDTTTIPHAPAQDGSVSWSEGWPEDYEKDMDADAHAKAVEREVMNFMFNAVTLALRQYQTAAFPEFITAADNGGSPYPYAAGTVVRYRAGSDEPFNNYVSLTDNNTATPGADASKWQAFMFAEASDEETAAGISGTLIISPRRLKKVAENLEEKIEESIKNNVDPFTVPIGGGMLWFTPVPPSGWLEANGQSFDGEENPELLAVYPNGRVPDLRGRFMRCWDHGAGVDPDPQRGILSLQEGQNKKHGHKIQLLKENARDIPPELLVKTDISKSQAIYEVPGANKNDQAAFITRDDYTKALEEGGDEARPANIAVMVIIKTDQAESETTDPAPTAIVITPVTSKLQAGERLQFKATVLPASVGGNYPVSWAVSDLSLGSINASGEYTSVAGQGGKQTVIASISTGLTATATVDQEIYLTSISIGAIPDELIVDQSYEIAVTYSPQNYSESVLATSSDSAVATMTPSGTLFVAGEGTATLSLTGASSGVTASVTVKTKAVEQQPVYLEIENNLSEIAAAGKESQAEARMHIGLGALATRDSLSAADVGAAPMASESLPEGMDLDDLTMPGDYFQSVSSNATLENHYPEETAGALRVVATGVSKGACRQFYWPYDSTKEYRRCGFGEPLVWGRWQEH
ncbi:TPA: tail fiber protein [Enterobacter sichuanensis]|nr:tail fiber protein [Enterobacter sichuanensis]